MRDLANLTQFADEASATIRDLRHEADICVLGAGLARMCTAIAAARHGASVAHRRSLLFSLTAPVNPS